MYSKYTDEAYNSAPCCGADLFARNTYTADNIGGVAGGDFWGGYMYYWDRGYQYIRKVNTFLEQMASGEMEFDEKPRLVAEAKFLRAFIYFELFKRYGGVPIVTVAYDLSAAEEVSFARNTVDEVVAFIEQDLDEAMADLPYDYQLLPEFRSNGYVVFNVVNPRQKLEVTFAYRLPAKGGGCPPFPELPPHRKGQKPAAAEGQEPLICLEDDSWRRGNDYRESIVRGNISGNVAQALCEEVHGYWTCFI